jgi:hypothetical protein
MPMRLSGRVFSVTQEAKSEGLSSREGASLSFGVAAGQSSKSVQRVETALEIIYVCDEGAGGNIFWVGGVVIGMID